MVISNSYGIFVITLQNTGSVERFHKERKDDAIVFQDTKKKVLTPISIVCDGPHHIMRHIGKNTN